MGSLSALALSSWYHRRMLERKRQAKHYQIVPGDDGDVDLELGDRPTEESGDISNAGPSLEAEVDNWDENVEDAWEEDDVTNKDAADGDGSLKKAPPTSDGVAVDEAATTAAAAARRSSID